MKRLYFSIAVLVVSFFALTYAAGYRNFKTAQSVIDEQGIATDGEIVEVLHEYGFNLDFYERPSTVDFIKSGIAKF